MKTALPLCIEMEPAPDLRDSAARLAVKVESPQHRELPRRVHPVLAAWDSASGSLYGR